MSQKRPTGPKARPDAAPGGALRGEDGPGLPSWLGGEGARRLRLNWAAAAALVGAVVLAGVAYAVVVRLNDRGVRAQVIAGAEAAERAGQVDLAIRNLSRYLDAHPDDLPVLEQLARITADTARGVGEALSAAMINDRLLRKDPDGAGRQQTRRRMVDLYVRCGDAHRASAIYRLAPEVASHELRYQAAEAIARELISRGEKTPGGALPGDHRLLAMALEGLAVPGDRGALEGSLREYEVALKGDPSDVVSAERLSRLYQERLGDADRGEAILAELVRTQPGSHRARLIRYRYFLRTHRADRALAELEEATRLAPDDLEVRLTAAGDSIRRGDGPAARRHLAAVPASLQGDLRVRVTRGMIDFSEERPDEAIDGWRQGLLTIGGTDAELTWWLAHALLQMGRVAEARPLVLQFRRLSGDDTQPLYRFLQAELDEKVGRPTRAILGLEWARDRIAENWQAMIHLALGRCYEAIWDESRALAAYRRATQVDARLTEARIAAARLLSGRPDEAILELERGLQLTPEDPALRVAMVSARLRQQAARPASSRSWDGFDRAMALARQTTPGHSGLLLMQADRVALAGDLPGALALLERGAGQAPKNPSLWTAWAEGLVRAGRPDEALGVLSRASAPGAAGDRAPIRIARARILLARGRGREARDLVIRGEKELPLSDRPLVWEALGRINSARGDARAALVAYTEWARLLPDDPRPRLTLLEMAEAIGDESTARAAVDALRELGGPEDIAWKLSHAQELLWSRAGDRPRSRRDPRLDEAARLLESVLVDAPELPAAHLLRGQVMERLRKPEEAAASYRRAWERGARPALPRLIEVLTRLRRFDEIAGLRQKAPTARVDQLSAGASFRAGDIESARRFVELVGKDGEGPGTRAWQARMLEIIGERDRADETLRSIVEQSPAEVDPWLALIQSLASHGKAREAAAAVERASASIRVADRPLELARLAWAAEDRPAADRGFRAAIEARPADVRTRLTASRYFEVTGRLAEAIACLREGHRAAPKDRAIARQLASLLGANPATWAEAFALIGPDAPGSDEDEDRLVRGLILANAPDPARKEQAVAALGSLIDDLPVTDPVAAAARGLLIPILLRQGKAEQASRLALMPAESALNPADLILYAETLLEAGKFAEADRQIRRLEAFKPDDRAATNLRARWVRASAAPGEAADALERAYRDRADQPGAYALGRAAFAELVALGPDALDRADRVGRALADGRPGSSWMPGLVLARRGRPLEALDLARGSGASDDPEDRRGAAQVAMEVATAPEVDPAYLLRAGSVLEDALRRDPRDYTLLIYLAMFRHVQGRFDDEARLYRSAIDLRPFDPVASNNLAWVLSEHLGRPDQAVAVLDEMILRHGRLAWALDTRGVALTRLGRLDDAIRDLQESAGDRPTPSNLFHLARACHKANRDEEFRRFRDQARRSGISPSEVDPSEREELATLMKL